MMRKAEEHKKSYYLLRQENFKHYFSSYVQMSGGKAILGQAVDASLEIQQMAEQVCILPI